MENDIVKNTKEINVWFKINPEEEEYLGEEWLEELNYFFSEGIVASKEKENVYGTGYGTGEEYIKCTDHKKFYEFLNFINDNRETLTVIKVVSLDKQIGNITYIEDKKYAEYIDMNSVDGIKIVSQYFGKDKNSLIELYKVNELDELQNVIKVNEENNYEFIDFIDSLKER
ncbi:hypothetical protein [Clostridium gasigenes]|uniref:Uncharacterized protein n=1 Tax=Clostridium gasigenes TaxID=94869 RepID=A0A7X0VSZ2_9CLOT|nr:hypothetical protein [Clostridium gasigenes]MBB6715066.1 hypothetical protein [Clostridium gasigenes]